MAIDLNGKAGIVTGGAHGIGRAYCLGLAKAGARVVVADIDFAGAQETVALIEKGSGQGLALAVDIADQQSTVEMAQASMEAFGQIDFLA